jgi:hypothetical protein
MTEKEFVSRVVAASDICTGAYVDLGRLSHAVSCARRVFNWIEKEYPGDIKTQSREKE